ncbi:MAG: FtsX-like permease family protein [Oscillatoriales cyanobacterium SM2_1_8]|nr:FtsX-like permease family protein [Oscillatoriales cyanobacterium SM2_1_8]
MLRRWLRKTPLAWLQLTRNKARFLAALAGIAFADVLMFVQMGFEGALYDSAMKPYREMVAADLAIASPQFQTLFATRSFQRKRLYQTLAISGVQSVTPLYVASGQWRNPETRQNRTILVWGIDPGDPGVKLPDLRQQARQLQQLDRVLFDRAGRPEYGDIATAFAQNGELEAQLNDKLVRVSGLFAVGSSFAADGNVIASDSTFLRLFPNRAADRIELGLIRLTPGADPQQVKATIAAALPDDVQVLTTEEWAGVERRYWETGTGIGFIFGLGVVVGFIVGIVIVYQILYSDVSDHLPEYATLKAMGYADRYLLVVLFQEALLLACLGFIPSFLFASGLYQLAYAATMLPIRMTVERALTVFALTLVMCTASGAIALRKLQTADPADIF